MQRTEEEDEPPRSRSSSRRNSASLSRRSSIQKEREGKKTAPSSATSTPKKQVKQNLDFCVTGRQLLKKSDRANSLPGNRRPSIESAKRRPSEAPKRAPNADSRDASLEDDALDLSQVSDFEDTNSKYGVQKKFPGLATSTPKVTPRGTQKTGSTSLQSQLHLQKMESSRRVLKADSRQSNSAFSCSRDSLYKTSSSSHRCGVSTDLDYSSVSPEYSGQSSSELSPRTQTAELLLSPRSQLLVSSCISSWQDASDAESTKVEECKETGEWSHFWENYNNSVAKVPMKSYYDQCPTPYRTENIDLADLDFSEASRRRSPDNLQNLNSIIREEGLRLTPRETQNIIKCAHILGSVLTRAIERRAKEKDQEEKVQEVEVKEEKEELKKTLTLDLKETIIPLQVKEEKKSETTQTDISLPNTKSAPKIFEKILRQLSKSSLEESLGKKAPEKEKEEEKEKKEDKEEVNL